MADLFDTHAAALDSPAQKAFAISPDDNNDLALCTRALYTGTTSAMGLVGLA